MCLGDDACDSGVTCAGSQCTVVCDGANACEDARVECNALQCDITCRGTSTCSAGVCCAGAECGTSCQSGDGGLCECP
jgi:hypothetical protein